MAAVGERCFHMWLRFGIDAPGDPFAGPDYDDTLAVGVQAFATGLQRDKDHFTRDAQSLTALSGCDDLRATAFCPLSLLSVPVPS